MPFSFTKTKHGFTLIEAIISTSVFLLFAAGIYSGIQYTFRSVYFSRVRILETAILNEEIEIIRNIPYDDVGIVNGSPAGVLERTTTTPRNGIDFLVTRTIRNIDDVFDGTIDGEIPDHKVAVCHDDNTLIVGEPALEPHLDHGDTEGVCPGDENGGLDTSAADYKFVEVSVICASCAQQNPITMSTFVAPRYLEGDPNNGALRIEVFENSYQTAVQGATVHVTASTTSSTIDITDTTNNDGELLLVDLPSALSAYHIVVTKSGYTTDMTTTSVANPLTPPASVIAENLQTISFEINPVSSITLTTVDALCQPIGYAAISARGERLIGTDPDVLATDLSVTTDGFGSYTFSTLSPDDYSFQASAYDVLGAIPILPVTVSPGSDSTLQLVLGANSTHSLLVHVQDSVSGQPIPSATVHITGPASYEETVVTGIGHTRQNDWSGGAGQVAIGSTDRYYSDNGNVDVTGSVGNVTLSTVGSAYVSSGWLESSTFDLGTNVTFQTLDWQPFVQPSETGASSLRFQIASDVSSTPSTWTFIGPDGTSGSYYDEFSTDIHSSHTGDQYFRYRAYFSTEDTSETPTLSDLSVTFTTSCTPPGQAYFGSMDNKQYQVDISADGYQSLSNVKVDVDGDTFFVVDLVAD